VPDADLPRVVLDTNVFVSGAILPYSASSSNCNVATDAHESFEWFG
jgi:predicted nucleic acid-binding protein